MLFTFVSLLLAASAQAEAKCNANQINLVKKGDNLVVVACKEEKCAPIGSKDGYNAKELAEAAKMARGNDTSLEILKYGSYTLGTSAAVVSAGAFSWGKLGSYIVWATAKDTAKIKMPPAVTKSFSMAKKSAAVAAIAGATAVYSRFSLIQNAEEAASVDELLKESESPEEMKCMDSSVETLKLALNTYERKRNAHKVDQPGTEDTTSSDSPSAE